MNLKTIFGKGNTVGNTAPSLKYLQTILKIWLDSPERKEALLAEQYYVGNQDILHRQRTMIGAGGQKQVVRNIPNNRLVDNQYKKLVDQKTNYALGKPITIGSSNDTYLQALTKIFDKRMFRKLRDLAQFAIDGGIAWVYPYYDKDGFYIKVFPAYEICPIWEDSSHDKLTMAIRYFSEVVIGNDGSQKAVDRVQVFSENGIDHYLYKNGSLLVDNTREHQDYLYVDNQGYNWERIPLIPFRYNQKEIPLIRNVKSLQDALNQVLSDFQNNMEEDPRNCILIIKNYEGTDLGEFRQNLATFGAVKVKTTDGVQGGIDTLRIEVDAENYKSILMQLKRAIIENGRGFDAKEERMDGDPNQMNIESMYTDIDLDVNAMETEFQAGFEDLIWFINKYFLEFNIGDFTNEKVEFVFNRDIFINEDSIIENCVKSVGLISQKTIISKHPWVVDLVREMNDLEDEKLAEQEESLAMQTAFNQDTKGGDNSDS